MSAAAVKGVHASAKKVGVAPGLVKWSSSLVVMLSTWDLVVLDTGVTGQFPFFIWLLLSAWSSRLASGTKAVWLAGKVVGAAEMAEECCPSCPALGSSAWPPKRFHVRGCHQHKERYRTYNQSGRYGGFGQGASCHFFLKLKPYWNQLLNFSCWDIARPEEWWSNDDQCFLCFLLWRAGGDLVLYGASHTKDWRGRGICDLSPLMSFAFPFDKRQTTSNSHHAPASTGGYFWHTLDSGHF